MFVLGPLSSILSVKYSYRTVTIVGGTFAAIGMILTYWATSIEYLYISYGVFVGTGAGLSFPPTVYIVTSYFSRFRGLANGLCISGSALGSIILPPVLRILLDSYGYRGACLIMGGITMNVWLAALFYDPVEKHMKRVKVKKNDNDKVNYGKSLKKDKILEELEEENFGENEPANGVIVKKAKFIFSHDDSTPVSTPTMDYKTDVFKFTKPNGFERSASAVVVPNIARAERSRKISTPIREHNRNDTFCSNLSSTPSLAMESSSNLRLNRFNVGRTSGTRQRTTSMKHSPSTSSFQYVSTPYHGTLSSLQPNEFASHLSLKSIASSINPLTKKRGVEQREQRRDDDEEIEEQSNCNKFFDLSLLTNPKYLIILISNCTNAIGYTNFIILLPAYAIELGFNKDLAAYLLSIVSTFDLIGRIGGSALSDLNLIPKTWFFVGGLCISGIGLTFLPLVSSYFWVSVLCSFFGLATGVYVGITAIVMADALGTERLTSSYGISLFVNGILQLVGPPICLNIFERIGVYQPIFTVLGLCLLFGSSLWCFMPCVLKKEKQDLQRRKAEENLLA